MIPNLMPIARVSIHSDGFLCGLSEAAAPSWSTCTSMPTVPAATTQGGRFDQRNILVRKIYSLQSKASP